MTSQPEHVEEPPGARPREVALRAAIEALTSAAERLSADRYEQHVAPRLKQSAVWLRNALPNGKAVSDISGGGRSLASRLSASVYRTTRLSRKAGAAYKQVERFSRVL